MIDWARDFPAIADELPPPTPRQRVLALEAAVALGRLVDALPDESQSAVVDAIARRVVGDG